MKKAITLLMAITISALIMAQVPDMFNYQTIVRDNSGNVLANKSVSFRMSILQNGSSGTPVYTETFQATSNDYGLVSLKIGQGVVLSGYFAGINWGAGQYYLKIELDPAGGSDYTLMGVSQLLSVPYAEYAKSIPNLYLDYNLNNTFLGYLSGQNNTDGNWITCVGSLSGLQNTTGTSLTCFGGLAGQNNMDGNDNVFLGMVAGQNNISGSYNTFVGHACGQNNLDSFNTMVGFGSGWHHTTGSHNVFVGLESAWGDSTGSNNVVIGDSAGHNNNGSGNVFLGCNAGSNETGSNLLYIANSNTSTPLIYGEFDKKTVTINDVIKLAPRNTEPANPQEGMLYVNSTDNHIYCYLNGAWKQLDN